MRRSHSVVLARDKWACTGASKPMLCADFRHIVHLPSVIKDDAGRGIGRRIGSPVEVAKQFCWPETLVARRLSMN